MPKIRITLFEGLQAKSDGEQIALVKDDRLIESATEFMNGPKDKHDGPIRVDFTMESRDDAEGLVKYLSQLALDLPLSEKAQKTYTRKTTNSNLLEKEPLMELLEHAFLKNKTQEQLLDYLRSLNFTMVTSDHLEDICKKADVPFTFKKHKETKKKLHTNYQFMMRILKVAKNPENDKYDTQIAFGIKFIGDKVPKVVVYLYGKFYKTYELHWENEKEIEYKEKKKFYKFAEGMTYEDRAKWRLEDKKMQDNPELEPSKFYNRWIPYVKILNPQEKKKKKA